jgi:hypothetical protein
MGDGKTETSKFEIAGDDVKINEEPSRNDPPKTAASG